MPEDLLGLSRRRLLAMMTMATAAATTRVGDALAAMPGPTAKLFHTETGAGRNVMLLHGWSCDSHDWSWQLPTLESRYRVVAVDLRGHGRSEVMPPGAYAPGDYAADIASLIAGHYPGEKFILIGHSMGGQIAARLAAARPDLVDAVVSVDGSLGFADTLSPLFQDVCDQLDAGDPGLVGPAFFSKFYAAQTDPATMRWQARRLQGMPAHVLRESLRPLFLGDAQVGVGRQSEALCRQIALPFYHLCRDPAQAARMQPWFSNPRSKVEAWADTGHWLMLDRKADFNGAVTAWIDAL